VAGELPLEAASGHPHHPRQGAARQNQGERQNRAVAGQNQGVHRVLELHPAGCVWGALACAHSLVRPEDGGRIQTHLRLVRQLLVHPRGGPGRRWAFRAEWRPPVAAGRSDGVLPRPVPQVEAAEPDTPAGDRFGA
jgi:hypothetical protein